MWKDGIIHFTIRITEQGITFLRSLDFPSEKYILGFFYNKLEEKDDAVGYLFGGLADEANSIYDFQKLAAYFQSFYKIKDNFKLDFSFRLEDYLYKYQGNSTDNYYYTTIPVISFAQSRDR